MGATPQRPAVVVVPPVSLEVLAGEELLVALAAVEFLIQCSLAGPRAGVDFEVTQQLLLVNNKRERDQTTQIFLLQIIRIDYRVFI